MILADNPCFRQGTNSKPVKLNAVDIQICCIWLCKQSRASLDDSEQVQDSVILRCRASVITILGSVLLRKLRKHGLSLLGILEMAPKRQRKDAAKPSADAHTALPEDQAIPAHHVQLYNGGQGILLGCRVPKVRSVSQTGFVVPVAFPQRVGGQGCLMCWSNRMKPA